MSGLKLHGHVLFIGTSMFVGVANVVAEPSLFGQTGLVVTPSARTNPEGTDTIGLAYDKPYAALYNTLGLWSNFEFTLLANRVGGVAGFADKAGYGSYKDKRFDWKLKLFNEGRYTPEIAVGSQDFYGTRLWGADYLVANKQFGPLDVSLGYGAHKLLFKGVSDAGVVGTKNRLQGLFGGVRYKPLKDYPLALVAEYDPIKYENDRFAAQSNVAERRGKINLAAEIGWQWLGLQASSLGGKGWGLNGYVNIPLNRHEYVPKVDDPPPYTDLVPKPTLDMWQNDPVHQRRLLQTLLQDDFKDIRLSYAPAQGVLSLRATNSRISDLGRAIGRAVRPMLLLGPLETKEIVITYEEATLPLATYTFFDLGKLRQYFNGQITRRTVADSISIRPGEEASIDQDEIKSETLAELDREQKRPFIFVGDDETGQFVSFRHQSADQTSYTLVPFRLASLLNDPSGAFQYRIFADANLKKRLTPHTFFDASVTATLVDSYRKEIDPSNSPIPHVRSDVALYARGSRVKLSNLTLNHYFNPESNWYGRVSGGLLEEMFAGVEGQLLYLPPTGSWAADFTLDAVKQRDYKAPFKFIPYQTVTGLLGIHYRFRNGFAATARIGRFLARDNGVRLELKRRFDSGIEMGGWVGVTDNKDYNASGSKGHRFIDKGVFLSLPTAPLLTRDSRAVSKIAVAEWGRDVAQFIHMDRDLYDAMEKPVIDLSQRDGLDYFADVNDNAYALPNLGSIIPNDDNPLKRLYRSSVHSIEQNGQAGMWIEAGLIGLTTWGSMRQDKTVNRWTLNHSRWQRPGRIANNMLPLLGIGFSGLLAGNAFQGEDTRAVGFAALTATAAAVSTAAAFRLLVKRASPELSTQNEYQRASRFKDRSFASLTSAATWATATTLATAYDAPWLYGVALAGNFANITSRKNWLSDSVAGALFGYGFGRFFAQQNANDIRLGVTANGILLTKSY